MGMRAALDRRLRLCLFLESNDRKSCNTLEFPMRLTCWLQNAVRYLIRMEPGVQIFGGKVGPRVEAGRRR